MKPATTKEDNIPQRIMLIVGAVFLLALTDALVKHLSDSAWGYLLFNEIPDAMTWLGMGMILTAGLVVLRQQ
ncbi:hypothetical protein [Vreelandella profundi]|uniref:hypothetical protein n=1 Tax=Vreelandella profundi TaxID=2852117 RepID=UPI001EF00B69|nr:hypothetical protein [Halomonas profundi]